MNIKVDYNYPIKDGTEVVFRSPVDCSQVTGLKVYYPDDGGKASSKEFVLADAHGNNVGDIDHLFAENVAVKVILDVTTSMAFVQNADTNAYLEGRFEELENQIGSGGASVDDVIEELGKTTIPHLKVDDAEVKRVLITEAGGEGINVEHAGQNVLHFNETADDFDVILRGIAPAELENDAVNKAQLDEFKGVVEPFKLAVGTEDNPVILKDLPSGVYHLKGYIKLKSDATKVQTGWNYIAHVLYKTDVTYVQLFNPQAHTAHHYAIYKDSSVVTTNVYLKQVITKDGGSIDGSLYTYGNLYTYGGIFMNGIARSTKTPTSNTDVANKAYVDKAVANAVAAAIEEGLTT